MAQSRSKTKFKSMRERGRERAQEQQKSGSSNTVSLPDGVEFFEIKKDRTRLDIIPYVMQSKHNPDDVPVGDLWWKRSYAMHRDVGPENTRVVCLKSDGRACPICEHVSSLLEDYDTNEKTIKAISAKQRELYNVLVDGDVCVWDISYHLFTKQLLKELDYQDPDDRWFADFEEGQTLVCRFNEESFGGNKYWEVDRIDFEDRGALKEGDLKSAVDLDASLTFMSYQALYALFWGVDLDDAPEGPASGPSTASRPAPSDAGRPPKGEPAKAEAEAETDRLPDDPDDLLDYIEDCDDHVRLLEIAEELNVELEARLKASKADTSRGRKKVKAVIIAGLDAPPTTTGSGDETAGTCPHGYDFGHGFDMEDECDECAVKSACEDACPG